MTKEYIYRNYYILLLLNKQRYILYDSIFSIVKKSTVLTVFDVLPMPLFDCSGVKTRQRAQKQLSSQVQFVLAFFRETFHYIFVRYGALFGMAAVESPWYISHESRATFTIFTHLLPSMPHRYFMIVCHHQLLIPWLLLFFVLASRRLFPGWLTERSSASDALRSSGCEFT